MNIPSIALKIQEYRDNNLRIFATTSVQPQSIPLLHIISKIDPSIPVYFINTGYLFPETLSFRDQLAREFALQIITIHPIVPKIQQVGPGGMLMFATDPDRCCFLNKVQPLEPILAEHDIWINGVRSDQTSHRKTMKIEQKAAHGTLRYHPMLNWTSRDIHNYTIEHKLPSHPLEGKGYLSIGCEPCTRIYLESLDDRGSRWYGMNKSECGLHTELVNK